MHLHELPLTILSLIASASSMAMINHLTFLPRYSSDQLGEHAGIERQVFEQSNDLPSSLAYDAQPNSEKLMQSWTMIVENPVNGIEATVGSRVELECAANGSPPPEILWFTGTDSVDKLEQQLRLSIQRLYNPSDEWKGIGRVISKLVIDCLTPADAGLIYCASVSNLKIQISTPTALIVNGDHSSNNCSIESEPTITYYSPTKVATGGAPVVLPCRATGRPAPTISWLDNNNNPITRASHPRHRILNSGDLLIEDLTWEDMGVYTCKAKSGHNEQQVGSFIYPLGPESEEQTASN